MYVDIVILNIFNLNKHYYYHSFACQTRGQGPCIINTSLPARREGRGPVFLRFYCFLDRKLFIVEFENKVHRQAASSATKLQFGYFCAIPMELPSLWTLSIHSYKDDQLWMSFLCDVTAVMSRLCDVTSILVWSHGCVMSRPFWCDVTAAYLIHDRGLVWIWMKTIVVSWSYTMHPRCTFP